MKVKITVPALSALARDANRSLKLAELGFTVKREVTADGAEYLICQDDQEKEITLEELMRLVKELKLIATIFPDQTINLEGA